MGKIVSWGRIIRSITDSDTILNEMFFSWQYFSTLGMKQFMNQSSNVGILIQAMGFYL